MAWLPNHSSLFGRSNPDHQITVSSILGHPYGRFLCLDEINPTTCFGSGGGWVTQLFHSGKTPNLVSSAPSVHHAIRSPLRRHYGVETTTGANQPRFTFDQGKHWDHVWHTSEIRGLCLMKWSREILKNLSYFWSTKYKPQKRPMCFFSWSMWLEKWHG